MPTYVFRNGEIEVHEEVYSPVINASVRDTLTRGILIFALEPDCQVQPEESKSHQVTDLDSRENQPNNLNS